MAREVLEFQSYSSTLCAPDIPGIHEQPAPYHEHDPDPGEVEGWPGEIRDSKVVDYGEPEESEESEERGEDEPSPDDEDLGDAAVDSELDERDAAVDLELDERDEAVDWELDERDEPEREGEDADSDEDFAQERPKRPARAGRSRSSSGARREQGERV